MYKGRYGRKQINVEVSVTVTFVIVRVTRNWNNSVTLFFDIYNVFQWILVNFRVLIRNPMYANL